MPYRLLEVDDTQSAEDAESPNMLIQGDNLEALKALLPYYAGRVRCILIDPPYNTQSAFDHYDDNLKHSQWLAMIPPRLQLLRELLTEDNSIWVTVDDHEGHHLKVLMDEVFGRSGFIADIAWKKGTERPMIERSDRLLTIFWFLRNQRQQNPIKRSRKSASI